MLRFQVDARLSDCNTVAFRVCGPSTLRSRIAVASYVPTAVVLLFRYRMFQISTIDAYLHTAVDCWRVRPSLVERIMYSEACLLYERFIHFPLCFLR